VADPGFAGSPPLDTPRAAGRRFSPLVTVVFSIVTLVYLGLPIKSIVSDTSPLTQLERPGESLERLVTRELDLDHVMRHGLPFERALYRLLAGGEEPTDAASGWYEELADNTDPAPAELRRAILLAEDGRVKAAIKAIEGRPDESERSRRMAAWVRAAYEGAPPPTEKGRALIAELRADLGPGWFADTLTARIADRIGDAAAGAQAEAAIVARGRALQSRLRLLMGLVAVMLVAGVVALGWTLARRPGRRVADAPIPADWPTADGAALFVRALGAPQAILAGLYFLHEALPLEKVLPMAADLAVFLWVVGYVRSRNVSLRGTFGLVPSRRGWPVLVGMAAILTAAALLGDTLIDAGTRLAGWAPHWADGFSEEMLWDSPWGLAVDTFSAVIWAPIVEELIFRGLLYATLRTRLGVWPSALISAVVFALPHGYALAGSLSVVMSGVLWALAYERTRSLLPGLLAHSANNVISTLWVVALLR
jgi:membrane protease YdiL (CAAX protease family)